MLNKENPFCFRGDNEFDRYGVIMKIVLGALLFIAIYGGYWFIQLKKNKSDREEIDDAGGVYQYLLGLEHDEEVLRSYAISSWKNQRQYALYLTAHDRMIIRHPQGHLIKFRRENTRFDLHPEGGILLYVPEREKPLRLNIERDVLEQLYYWKEHGLEFDRRVQQMSKAQELEAAQVGHVSTYTTPLISSARPQSTLNEAGRHLLCKVCTGPMELSDAVHFFYHCPYCGANEQLPADERQRIMEIEKRVEKVKLEEKHTQSIETYFREDKKGGTIGIVLLLIFALGPVFLVNLIGGDLKGVRILVYAGVAALFLAGLYWIVVRFIRQKKVPIAILALPSTKMDGNARCRVCGAELPLGEGLMRCESCDTTSVVSDILVKKRKEVLEKKSTYYQSYLSGLYKEEYIEAQKKNWGVLVVYFAIMMLFVLFQSLSTCGVLS